MSALLIILTGAGYYYYATLQEGTKNEAVIETSTIGTGDIILTAAGIGEIIPSEEVSFGFKNNGRVSEVLVSLGDNVEKGQVLARLESQTLELKYKQAEANLAALSSPSGIAAAEQSVEDTKQSFAIARDNLQFLIGPDLLLAEEKVANVQSELKTAMTAAEKDGTDANKQKVADAKSALAKAQEALTYIFYTYSDTYTTQTFTYPIRNDKGVTVRRQLITPTDAEVSAARAAYELAVSNLEDAKNYLDVLKGRKTTEAVPASSVTSITEAQIAFDQAKANLDANELTAPISGTITSITLNVGEDGGTSSVVAISDFNQPYMIDTYLDETDWDKARVGYNATVTFDLLPEKEYSGNIVQVYPVLEDFSGTSMVHILVQLDTLLNVDLPAGSTASVDIVGGKALGAVLVPTSALKEVEPGKYIIYLIQNGAPVKQEVEIGLQDILYAELKSGLQIGDMVMTNASAVDQ
jgi:HlyD family secretion protein